MTKLEVTLIVVVIGLVLFVTWSFYERHEGAVACIQSAATTVAKAEVKNTQVEAAGHSADTKAGTTYDATLADPLAPLPPVRVYTEVCASPLPSTRPPASTGNSATTVRITAAPSMVSPEWGTFERFDVQGGRDADAEVIYLQSLLAAQYAVCKGKL